MPGMVIGSSASFVGQGEIGAADASVTNVAVGQVTETDTAQPITWAPKNRLVNQVIETDIAQAITRVKIYAVGQVTKTDTAQPITKAISKPVGQVVETDTAQALGIVKYNPVDQIVETDTAQPISTVKLLSVPQVVETDTAQPITVGGATEVAVGQVIETDTAQPINVLVISKEVAGATGGWGQQERKPWPLPPPAFPLEKEIPYTPIVEKVRLRRWIDSIPKKPNLTYKGIIYIPPPKVDRPIKPNVRIAQRFKQKEDGNVPMAEIIKYYRNRDEEENLVIALLMQDKF